MKIGYSVFLPYSFSNKNWSLIASALTRSLNFILRPIIGVGDFRIYPDGEIVFTKFSDEYSEKVRFDIQQELEKNKDLIDDVLKRDNFMFEYIAGPCEFWDGSYACEFKHVINLSIFLNSYN